VERPSDQPVRLPPVFDRRAVEPARRAMLDAVERGPLVLDGSAVRRLEDVAARLVLAAAGSAAERGRPFALRAPSRALLDDLDALGLGAQAASWIEP
jgi:anti-anti-sigma regulatory factor